MYSLELLEEKIRLWGDDINIIIIGTGWIAKMVCYYLEEKCGIINFNVAYPMKEDIEWNEWNVAVTNIRNMKFENNTVSIIAVQENEQNEILQYLQDIGNDKYISITEKMKDELDQYIMRTAPEKYEAEIVVNRKKELDLKWEAHINASIEEKWNRPEFPLFYVIEIETLNYCNGDCSFCPVNKYDDTRQHIKMNEKLFLNIIKQLKELDYQERIDLFSNNEPFIDDRIYEFAKITKNNLPKSHVALFSNGTLLNLEGFKKIIPYLDTLCIDLYCDDKMQIPLNIIEIIRYCLTRKELQKKVMVQMIDKKAIRNNRGGQSKNRHKVYQLKTKCRLPYGQMIVRPDGKISLCCNDPLGKYTLGDLTKDTLIDIWRGKQFYEIREKMYKEGREGIDMCKLCDNFATTNENGHECFSEERFTKCWNWLSGQYECASFITR